MYTFLKINKSWIFLLTLFLFIACETHVQEDEFVDISVPLCDPDTSFKATIKPIIDANCIRCHNGSQFPNLSTFNGVSRNANSVKNQVVSRRMPLGGSLTSEEIELIRCWIDNGAKNN